MAVVAGVASIVDMAFMLPIVLAVVVVVAIVSLLAGFGRARAMIDRWAARNGLRVIEAERRLFWYGPFFLSTSKSQVVYRVTVEAANGQVRRGYARCGGYLLGLWTDRVDVRWDDPPAHQPGFPVIVRSPGSEE